MEKIALVAAGGALGAVLRFLTAGWALRSFGPGFPWGTLAVNVAGSFAMGLVAVWILERTGGWARLGPFLMTGVLGGFTTFSAFSLEILFLAERGRVAMAAGYAAGSVGLSVGALWIGLALGRSL